MSEIKEKIELFNESHKPFDITVYEDARYGKYNLGVPLNFLKGEYENYGRNAFNKYAEKIGEPVKVDGLYTHGNGHEWKNVFCYYFSKEEGLEQINFDCEAGGFYCSSDNLDLLIDFGHRFRELCENEEKFESVVVDALTEVDFKKVVESYKTPEFAEAKELLKLLHEEFCEAFGTSDVDELIDGEDVFIHLPAVMRSRETGELCVGLVYVDTESSGEHWGTAFAFSNGFVNQEDKDINNPMVEERKAFGVYDYWYTPDYDRDIHSDRNYAPDEVKAILDYAIGEEEQTQGMNMDGM